MSRPRILNLPKPTGDGEMAEALLFMLQQVRAGQVKALSVVLVVETSDDDLVFVKGASADGSEFYEMALLGAMRSAEHDLVERRRERAEET